MANNITLRIYRNGQVLYQSDRRWIMPLFDFEEYLHEHPVDTSGLEYHDKVVGKAAALLMLRLGAGSVHAQVMSKLAQHALDRAGIPYTFHTLVERIDCQTEEILQDIDDLEAAYAILRERAKLPLSQNKSAPGN